MTSSQNDNSQASPLSNVREEYHASPLSEKDLPEHPITLARRWVEEAVTLELTLPNAMTLATVNAKGQPSTRTVLLKNIDEKGFVFFTHHDGRKGSDIAVNPSVSFTMFWPALDRQLTVIGQAAKTDRETAENYFHDRPRESQLSAAISPQSRPIQRETLLQKMQQAAIDYPAGTRIAMPDTWGGYLITPHEVQFWLGRPGRLHDRFQYLRQPDGSWQHQRLAP